MRAKPGLRISRAAVQRAQGSFCGPHSVPVGLGSAVALVLQKRAWAGPSSLLPPGLALRFPLSHPAGKATKVLWSH